ncbi:MAG: ABC transporter ATP-binding protein [Candidatus Krumholzibacteriia bacterium]
MLSFFRRSRFQPPAAREPTAAAAPRASGDERPAVRLHRLVKRYGRLTAVDGIDLSVPRGVCFGLLGPNGAGKTTTVEILEGLAPWDSGEVEVLGESWGRGRDRQLRARLGVQLQETNLPEKLTVAETVRLFRSFYPHGRELDAVVALAGLEEKRRARVGKLSGGQRQRLALACALVSSPELLFLDEPTTGLDPQARRRLWDLVEEYRDAGGTVLLTTHNMEEAHRLCDRVAILDRGRILAEDTPDRLVAALGAEQVVEFRATGTNAAAAMDGALAELPGVRGLRRRDASYVLTVGRIGTALPALLAELESRNVSLESLQTHQATLEDVFVHLTGRGLRDEA